MGNLDINKIDPDGIGHWRTNRNGDEVYCVRPSGREYRKDGTSYDSFLNPEGTTLTNCFVATSAFENQDHPTVNRLRQYRDDVLSQSQVGRMLVHTYYGGLGEAGASVLDSVPSLKPAVRVGLDFLVEKVVEPKLKARNDNSQN